MRTCHDCFCPRINRYWCSSTLQSGSHFPTTAMLRLLLAAAFVLTTCLAGLRQGSAAEVAILTEKNWDEFAPQGKEVDCIYGDIVLRNDKIIVVIAQPLPSRNANMTVRG